MSKKYFKLDSQILDAFSRCERAMKHGFIDNLTPMGTVFSIQRGSLVHDMLKLYYETYKKLHDRTKASIDAIDFGRSRINHYDAIDIPRGMEILESMREYFNYYSNERWIPVDIERIHKKLIYEDDEVAILYIAKMDLTVGGEPEIPIMPVDHKTYDRWFDPLALENQFTGYAHVIDADYLVVNKIGFQKSYPPDKKHRRIKLSYSQGKREEWVHNTVRLVKDMIFCIENDSFPMRRTQCGMYGGCRFKPICEVDYRARLGVIQKLYKEIPAWNPESLEERDE
jgi:hypothetical protein